MMSRSLWHVNSQNSELRLEELVTNLESNLIEIKTKYSMVSTGTEYSVCTGLVSDRFSDKMGVPYMKGDFSFPIKYGYACSGIDSDSNLYHFMHPHQDYCLIKDSDLYSIASLAANKVPLISNMETVLNAIWDADLKDNDTIAIIGYGNVGCLLAETLRCHKNINPIIIENDNWRLNKASENGFEVDNGTSNMYDLIFNTTASNSAVNMALTRLQMEGRLIELSWYADREVSLKLGEHFHYNRLRIISSQVSQIPRKLEGQMTYKKRKKIAVDILSEPCFDKLITDEINFENAPSFFRDLRNKKQKKGLIYLFKY